MRAARLGAGLAAAAGRMEEVLAGLRAGSPEDLNASTGLLELACRELAGEADGLHESSPAEKAAILPAALELRTRIGHARRLLENVYQFHGRWARWLGAHTGGYLPDGQAAPFAGAPRLCLRG